MRQATLELTTANVQHPYVCQRAGALLSLLLIAACFFTSSVEAMRREDMKLHTAKGVKVISVEITETQEEKMKGLMYRPSLPDNQGMIFAYDPPREITMWMRNTYIPLDMVFIRPDGVIHRIEAWTRPFSEEIIASKGDVAACLELAGGAAERMGLKPGDRVEHSMFGRKK
jgi:uncharacterized membrane protein (UPF0127 family)